MKNERGRVVYIGKASNLRRRLGQYFQAANQQGKVASLVQEICEIEVILVSSELESLILENNLIKRYKPPYNVFLVSDHSGYGYIVQTSEFYPRLVPYRKNSVNKALGRTNPNEIEKRFGPYLSRKISSEVLKVVAEMCGLRTCDPMPRRACYLFHLKRCLGPCERYVTQEEYLAAVEKAGKYLAAPHLNLVDHLTAQMHAAAEALEFERAKHIRDQIAVIKTVFERQAVERDIPRNQDAVYLEGGSALILHLVRGALLSLDYLPCAYPPDAPESFLLEHYQELAPHEIITLPIPDPTRLEEALSAAHGHRVRVTVPLRGAARDLLEIARINFQYRQEHFARSAQPVSPPSNTRP